MDVFCHNLCYPPIHTKIVQTVQSCFINELIPSGEDWDCVSSQFVLFYDII